MKKPFKLDDALLGAKVITRDGRRVTELRANTDHLRTSEYYALSGLIEGGGKRYWSANGKWVHYESGKDLFMEEDKPKKRPVAFRYLDEAAQKERWGVGELQPDGTLKITVMDE